MQVNIKGTLWISLGKSLTEIRMYATYSNHFIYEYDILKCDGNLNQRLQHFKNFKRRCEIKSRVVGSCRGLQKLRLDYLSKNENKIRD